MGVVYEAEQEHPRRTVALKIIKPGMTSSETIRRFEEEARALGRLQHPGIAQIYEAGTADTGLGPQPYFAMELIDGLTPRDYLERHKSNTRQRLELMARTAEAVHHAHQRGLIHRDLKPSNILVDETGQPKVLDFGVARAIDSESQVTRRTDVGQLIGTLAYMSPEQVMADPNEVDTRSDVYSLGVILYELLARHLPYKTNKKLHEALKAIREEDPTPLGKLDRSYRGDIETIVAKALEKDKARRYTSAAELAADIRRCLADQPIVARPPAVAYQLTKFARRNRALVTGVAAVFLVLILGIFVSSWQARRAAQAEQAALKDRDRAQHAEVAAREAEAMAREEQRRAISAEIAATNQRNVALEAEKLASKERDRAIKAETQVRQDRDRLAWQNLARESVRLSSSRIEDDLAALLARQAFLIQRRTLDSHSSSVETALQQAGRATLWSHSFQDDEATEMWDVTFSPDGVHLATNGKDGSVALWNLRRTDAPVAYFRAGEGLGPAKFVKFSPDGTLLAAGGYGPPPLTFIRRAREPVRIWDLRKPEKPPILLEGHSGEVRLGAFSPDGKHLATSDSETLRLWDVRNPRETPLLLQLRESGVSPNFMTFSPDGMLLALATRADVRIWNMHNLDASPRVFQTPPDTQSVAFSPDSRRLAVAGRDSVRLWELVKPDSPRIVHQGSPSYNSVTFSPDGRYLAAGGTDSAVRIWELSNLSTPPLILRGHQGVIRTVAFSADGALLASAALDYTVRIWELRQQGGALELQPATPAPNLSTHRIAFSADGASVLSGVTPGFVKAWELRYPREPILLENETIARSRSMAFSPDGQRVAVGLETGEAWIYDVHDARAPLIKLPWRDDPGLGVNRLEFSPDGTLLAVSTSARQLWLWDLRSFTVVPLSVSSTAGLAGPIAFSRDGSKLAMVNDPEVRVWDLRKPGSPPVVLLQPSQPRNSGALALSPDGTLLAVGATDVRVWDLKNLSATPLLFKGFPSFAFYSLEFSPDGTSLAGGNMRNATLLWELNNPNTPPTSFPFAGSSVAFSPDGHRLAIGSGDRSVRVLPVGPSAADYLCNRVWRNLSLKEWRLYVGEGIPYERTCPALPAGAGAPSPPK
jgi:WD40 repeat protein